MALDFSSEAPEFAQRLLGCELIVVDKNGQRGGVIIETEAYTADDPASHSFRGMTGRNAAMFMDPGTIYIYRIYGIHYCLNIVCGNRDGQAVLIRSLLPTRGLDYMRTQRGTSRDEQLCSGPAKLFQALSIDPILDQTHILKSPIQLLGPTQQFNIEASARIGITKAADTMWRFNIRHSS